MTRLPAQSKLLDLPEHLPNGLVYRPDFLTATEEATLVSVIQTLPLEHAPYKEYTARRRILSFGWGFDFSQLKKIPKAPIPLFLKPLVKKSAKWLNIPETRFNNALITEYQPGTPLGWHRDVEDCEHIVGISLAGWCQIRFRPLADKNTKSKQITLELEPRSAYIMQQDIRWKYQHSVAPTKTLRYSITLRTAPKSA